VTPTSWSTPRENPQILAGLEVGCGKVAHGVQKPQFTAEDRAKVTINCRV